MTDPVVSSTIELAASIRARQISAVEVLQAHLIQIEKHNQALNAVVIIDAERALARASRNRLCPVTDNRRVSPAPRLLTFVTSIWPLETINELVWKQIGK